MPCQICGKESGYSPLCKAHQKMIQEGKVTNCDDCGTWFLTDVGCEKCKSVSPKFTENQRSTVRPIAKPSEPQMSTKGLLEEDRTFGHIISIGMLSFVMQKDPIPDRHNTLQFDLAAELLLSSPDCDVRVDIAAVRNRPRAHIWYFEGDYNAPIMFRMIRRSMTAANKERAWNNYLQDLSKLENLISDGNASEAFCLLFTDDNEYKRKIVDSTLKGNIVDLSSGSKQSKYHCLIYHIDSGIVGSGSSMSFRGSSQTTTDLPDLPTDDHTQRCLDCGRIIPTNPNKPRCYKCWSLKYFFRK